MSEYVGISCKENCENSEVKIQHLGTINKEKMGKE